MLISVLRAPSTLYSCSMIVLILDICSSVSSLTRMSGLTPALSRIFFADVLPMPKMYGSAASTLLSRGRSMPAIRAKKTSFYPWRCLCLGLEQITLTTPLRLTILHFSQRILTLERTFIDSPLLVPVDYPAAIQIVRRQFQGNLV